MYTNVPWRNGIKTCDWKSCWVQWQQSSSMVFGNRKNHMGPLWSVYQVNVLTDSNFEATHLRDCAGVGNNGDNRTPWRRSRSRLIQERKLLTAFARSWDTERQRIWRQFGARIPYNYDTTSGNVSFQRALNKVNEYCTLKCASHCWRVYSNELKFQVLSLRLSLYPRTR